MFVGIEYLESTPCSIRAGFHRLHVILAEDIGTSNAKCQLVNLHTKALKSLQEEKYGEVISYWIQAMDCLFGFYQQRSNAWLARLYAQWKAFPEDNYSSGVDEDGEIETIFREMDRLQNEEGWPVEKAVDLLFLAQTAVDKLSLAVDQVIDNNDEKEEKDPEDMQPLKKRVNDWYTWWEESGAHYVLPDYVFDYHTPYGRRQGKNLDHFVKDGLYSVCPLPTTQRPDWMKVCEEKAMYSYRTSGTSHPDLIKMLILSTNTFIPRTKRRKKRRLEKSTTVNNVTISSDSANNKAHRR
jgi:hypothetical protein